MLLFGYHSLGTQDGFYERSVWQVNGTIVLKGNRIEMGRGTKLSVSGLLSLGDRFTITGRSTIICHSNMHFGDNVLISWDVLLMDTDFHSITDESDTIINHASPIIVGDDVWIGCKSTILKGTAIPSKSVIAAGALIAGKMEVESCIYSSDRKILKRNIIWHR
jgi:acetyltransferase-like isoleucine patch superfamily enzyme